MLLNRNRTRSAWPITALLLSALTVPVCAQRAAGNNAVLSGEIRDGHGEPQPDVVVQLFSAHSNNSFDDLIHAAVAFTDSHGHYVFTGVLPGEYAVRATAALYLPAVRDDLRLLAGSRTVVNMTLATLFQVSDWLPAERRRADEPSDDWKWTLRSTASRPVLRLAGHRNSMSISSEHQAAQTEARLAMTNGDGSFAAGGLHSVFTVDRMQAGGNGMLLRADLGSPQPGYPVAPSADLSAGYERRVNYGTTARIVTAFSSHPELVSGIAPGGGMQSVLLESAEQMRLGDLVGIDAGAEMMGVQIDDNAVAVQPFVKVVVSPSQQILVTYRMATARDFQDSEDMNTLDVGAPQTAIQHGRVRIQGGTHQELSVARRTRRGTVQAAWYHDRIVNPMVNGGGVLSNATLMTGNYVADPATASFRMVGSNYQGSGVNVAVNERLTNSLWAVFDYSTGTALALQAAPVSSGQMQQRLAQPDHGMRAVSSQTATAALRGRIAKTNTHLRAAYRWQPQHTLTPVDPYHAFSDQAYLSFYVRQPLHVRGILPRGTEATLDVTNLLAQGYQPVGADADGQSIYFAQAERAIEAGLSFTF